MFFLGSQLKFEMVPDPTSVVNQKAMKVLHIGNIANNAYWAAVILNDAGHDSTVLCKDYYHIMGCPEWEEVYLHQTPADQFNPKWYEVVSKDYSRPSWFVQGREATCLKFLAEDIPSNILAKTLALESGIIPLNVWNVFSVGLISYFEISLSRGVQKFLEWLYLHHTSIYSFLKAVKRALRPEKFSRATRRLFWHFDRDSDRDETLLGEARVFDARVAELCEKYRTEFPNSTPLVPGDFSGFQANYNLWASVLKKYDFVIGYALDGIYPLLLGVPYAAFEHGTIREIPYEETSRGRLCKLTYRMANHCFVTNIDCIDSAKYLSPERFTVINHPFDETVACSYPKQSDLRNRLLFKLDASFLIFHPTRQDWKVGTGPADKANDAFWRAIGLLRTNGVKVGVVCTKWGKNVPESVRLIHELGIQPHVEWIDPQATLPILAMCAAADLVADQFSLGAFGGILPKALACGTPVLTYLERGRTEGIFAESPPVLNCRTVEEIVFQVELAYGDKDFLEALAAEGARWVANYHSKALFEEELNRVLSAMSREAADTKGYVTQ